MAGLVFDKFIGQQVLYMNYCLIRCKLNSMNMEARRFHIENEKINELRINTELDNSKTSNFQSKTRTGKNHSHLLILLIFNFFLFIFI